jgi:hypothetical protein
MPASSVRNADWTAASAAVPDDFAISGFELAISDSEGEVAMRSRREPS